jgi:nicotinamide riboside transporter PnuC
MTKNVAWLGVLSNLLGALLVAYNGRILGYSFFVIGALIFILTEYRNRNNPQVTLNGAYLFINVLGLYHAIKN